MKNAWYVVFVIVVFAGLSSMAFAAERIVMLEEAYWSG
jgi:hypothetical protein